MSIVITIAGCLLGVVLFMIVALVTPIANWGYYSTGLLVATCLIMTAFIGGIPWPWRK